MNLLQRIIIILSVLLLISIYVVHAYLIGLLFSVCFGKTLFDLGFILSIFPVLIWPTIGVYSFVCWLIFGKIYTLSFYEDKFTSFLDRFNKEKMRTKPQRLYFYDDNFYLQDEQWQKDYVEGLYSIEKYLRGD